LDDPGIRATRRARRIVSGRERSSSAATAGTKANRYTPAVIDATKARSPSPGPRNTDTMLPMIKIASPEKATASVDGRTRSARLTAHVVTRPVRSRSTAIVATRASTSARHATNPNTPNAASPPWRKTWLLSCVSTKVPTGGTANRASRRVNGPWNPAASSTPHTTSITTGTPNTSTGVESAVTTPRAKVERRRGIGVDPGGRGVSSASRKPLRAGGSGATCGSR
jgi:hypothetical protein